MSRFSEWWYKADVPADENIAAMRRTGIITLFILLGVLVFGVMSAIHQSQRATLLMEETLAGNRQVIETMVTEMESHRLRNEEVHGEIARFVACMLMIRPEERSDDDVYRCAAEAVAEAPQEPVEPGERHILDDYPKDHGPAPGHR